MILIFFTSVIHVQNSQSEPQEIRCISAVRFNVQVEHESPKNTHCIDISIDFDVLDICEDIAKH